MGVGENRNIGEGIGTIRAKLSPSRQRYSSDLLPVHSSNARFSFLVISARSAGAFRPARTSAARRG